jgi:hypothetical protein
MAVTVKELKDYTETELQAELKRREEMKGGWASLVVAAASSSITTKPVVVRNSQNGCRVEWPVQQNSVQQYLMPSGTEVRKFVQALAKDGGYYWLGFQNGNVYLEVVANGPVPK